MGLGGLGAIGEANVEPTAMVDDVLTPGEMHINPNPTEQEELVRNIALGLFVGGVALTAAGVAIQRPARRPEERL